MRLRWESGVARSTAETYFAILEDTLLGHFLPAWRPRFKVREAARKYRPIAYYRTPAGVEVDFVIETYVFDGVEVLPVGAFFDALHDGKIF